MKHLLNSLLIFIVLFLISYSTYKLFVHYVYSEYFLPDWLPFHFPSSLWKSKSVDFDEVQGICYFFMVSDFVPYLSNPCLLQGCEDTFCYFLSNVPDFQHTHYGLWCFLNKCVHCEVGLHICFDMNIELFEYLGTSVEYWLVTSVWFYLGLSFIPLMRLFLLTFIAHCYIAVTL